MALYPVPETYNGDVNPVFNSTDYQTPDTIKILNNYYLNKLNGGSITGSSSFTKSLTLPFITLSNTQTSSQLGYFSNINRSVSGANVVNGGLSTPLGYCTLSLPAGVYEIKTTFSISSPTDIYLTSYKYGLSASTSSFDNSENINSSYVSEFIPATKNKYLSAGHIFTCNTTTNIYNLVQISWNTSTTNPVITINNWRLDAYRIA